MEIFLAMAVNFITMIVKKYIKPQFGESGVQMFVFLLAFVFVGGKILLEKNESLRAMSEQFALVVASAITMYEVLWKKLFGK